MNVFLIGVIALSFFAFAVYVITTLGWNRAIIVAGWLLLLKNFF